MALTLATLLPDYKASLSEAASAFRGTEDDADADFKRHLRTAVIEVSRTKRPRTLSASFTVVADQAEYGDVPADLITPKVAAWGRSGLAPWNLPRPPLPTLSLAESGGSRVLVLQPPPRADQIAAFGSTYAYYYYARHSIEPGSESLPDADAPLVILRAQVEAMRELTFRNYNKPVTLRAGSGLGGAVMSKNMTPPAIYEMLLKEYQAAA